jgi:hypothetical protein
MIGIYGVIGPSEKLLAVDREAAFRRMSSSGPRSNPAIHGAINGLGFSIGLLKRHAHPNRDLVLTRVSEQMLVALFGYAKFPGDARYSFVSEIADRVVDGYIHAGVRSIAGLAGSFAALFLGPNEWVLIGDRFGSKSVYYSDLGNSFVFAPDVRRIVESGLIPRERDLEGAQQVLAAGFFLGDRTLVQNLRRFPYASWFEQQTSPPGPVKFTRYWTMPAREGAAGPLTNDLLDELSHAVDRTITSLDELAPGTSVPLSGGLDSRCIACFLAGRHPIRTLTYDSVDEVRLAGRVARILGAHQTFFTDPEIGASWFRRAFLQRNQEQRIHAVGNQYFYSPLFEKYFLAHPDVSGIYDGVYMDILFSAPYTYPRFDAAECARIYGKATQGTLPQYSALPEKEWKKVVPHAFEECCAGYRDSDAVGRSQLWYLTGRLRRYVNECGVDRETYGYVLRPGMDYCLCDFGFSLRLALRRGELYRRMLSQRFPAVMKVPYKDSYGNREKTAFERVEALWNRGRTTLCSASRGWIPYYPYQTNRYFYSYGGLDACKPLFEGRSYVEELIPPHQLRRLYNESQQKHYLLNLLQRVWFIQQFYQACGF